MLNRTLFVKELRANYKLLLYGSADDVCFDDYLNV